MTDKELRERAIAALARVRATTPRPWFREMEQDGETLPDGTGYAGEWYEGGNIVTGPDGCGDIGYAQRASDAAFFVAAPDDVEVLAEAVLRLLEPVEYHPGLPSVEQVRAHAQHVPHSTCQIRYPDRQGSWPEWRQLVVIDAGMVTNGKRHKSACVGMPCSALGGMVLPLVRSEERTEWRPCLPDGTPCSWPEPTPK